MSVPTITFSAPHRDDRSSLRREEDQSVLVALPASDSGTQIRDVNVLKVQFTELTDSNPGVEEDGEDDAIQPVLACVRDFLEAIQFLTIERLGEPAARARSLEVIWPRVPQPIEEVSGRSETIGDRRR